MSEHLLWRLPYRISGYFVLSFLSLYDIVQLDRSCCSRRLRKVYLETLRFNHAAPENEMGIVVTAAAKWSSSRGVKYVHFVVNRSSEELEQLLAGKSIARAVVDLHVSSCTPMISYNRFGVWAGSVHSLELETVSSCAKVPQHPALCNLKRLNLFVDNTNAYWALQLIANNGGLSFLCMNCVLEGCEQFLDSLCTMEHLLTLRIGACDIGAAEGIASISLLCPNLTTLEVIHPDADYATRSSGIKFIWEGKGLETAVAECVRRAHKLRALTLPQMLTDTILLALAESNNGVPHLTELNMPLAVQDATTIQSCTAVLARIQHFEGVHLNFLVCPKSLQQVVLQCMSRLKRLTVPGSYLGIVAKLGVNLSHFNVVCSETDATDRDLPRIVRRCNSLQLLHGQVTKTVLYELARSCPQLHSLTAGSICYGVSAVHLQHFVQHCSKLVQLNLPLNTAMNDTVLRAITRYCADLRVLHIHHGTRVTEDGLVQLVASCKYLRELVLHCSVVGVEVPRRLVAIARHRGRKLTISSTDV
jgi:hypothetical protein